MHKQTRIRLTLLLVSFSLLILGSQLYHSKIQAEYTTFSVEKNVISKPTTIKISPTPVKLMHYHQATIKGKVWSELTVYSPVEQQVNVDNFKLYRGDQDVPNIYFDDNLRINSKNTRKLNKGINSVLMSTEYSSNKANNQLIIINKHGLHYTQHWLKATF